MAKKIYVGNLSFDTTESGLSECFSKHGEVHSVNLVTDRDTGRSRGFAFVEMDPGPADAAIAGPPVAPVTSPPKIQTSSVSPSARGPFGLFAT